MRESGNTRSGTQQQQQHHQQQRQQRQHQHQRQQQSPSPHRAAATATTVSDETAARHFRSVHIGVKSNKRWLSLKKRLDLRSDEDVVVYLLDLAESGTAVTRYVVGVIVAVIIIVVVVVVVAAVAVPDDGDVSADVAHGPPAATRQSQAKPSCHAFGVWRSVLFPPTLTPNAFRRIAILRGRRTVGAEGGAKPIDTAACGRRTF